MLIQPRITEGYGELTFIQMIIYVRPTFSLQTTTHVRFTSGKLHIFQAKFKSMFTTLISCYSSIHVFYERCLYTHTHKNIFNSYEMKTNILKVCYCYFTFSENFEQTDRLYWLFADTKKLMLEKIK